MPVHITSHILNLRRSIMHRTSRRTAGTLPLADDTELLAMVHAWHQGKPNFFRAAVSFSNPARHCAKWQT